MPVKEHQKELKLAYLTISTNETSCKKRYSDRLYIKTYINFYKLLFLKYTGSFKN